QVQRDVTTQGVAIRGLEQRLDAFGRKRASARVDVDGVAAANAQVSELERRLDRLERRYTARVNVRGGGGGRSFRGGGGGFGGGGIGGKLALLPFAMPLINTAAGAGGAILG